MKTATQLASELQTSISMVSRIADSLEIRTKYGSSFVFSAADQKKIAAILKEKRKFRTISKKTV